MSDNFHMYTKWIVDYGELPDVVCFVDSASDHIRARYVDEKSVPNREAELCSRWEAAVHEVERRDALLEAIWKIINDEYPNGGFPDMKLIEDELKRIKVVADDD